MSKAPEVCLYCDGAGKGTSPENPCGFCENGKPLDSQEDWDESWGKMFVSIGTLIPSEEDQEKIAGLLERNETLKKERLERSQDNED